MAIMVQASKKRLGARSACSNVSIASSNNPISLYASASSYCASSSSSSSEEIAVGNSPSVAPRTSSPGKGASSTFVEGFRTPPSPPETVCPPAQSPLSSGTARRDEEGHTYCEGPIPISCKSRCPFPAHPHSEYNLAPPKDNRGPHCEHSPALV